MFLIFSQIAFKMLKVWVEDCRLNDDPEDSIKERIAMALTSAGFLTVARDFGLLGPVEQEPVTYTDPETGSLVTDV